MECSLRKELVSGTIASTFISTLLLFGTAAVEANDSSAIEETKQGEYVTQQPSSSHKSQDDVTVVDFRKRFPEPYNLADLMNRWNEINLSFQQLNINGLNARVTIIKADDSFVHGTDVYTQSGDIRQLREYRGDRETFTYNGTYCTDAISVMTPEMEEVVTKLPSPDHDVDWFCDETTGIDYGLYRIDPDYVLTGSVQGAYCDKKACESLKLIIAQDLVVRPGGGRIEITVVYGKLDGRPESLRIRYNYAPGNIEYSQWDYDYNSAVEYIAYPTSRVLHASQEQ